MKIIIPMSGLGIRFKEKGYNDPKPLIVVSGKPIIEHVVGMFPKDSDFIFICNKNHLRTTDMRDVLNRIAPHGKVIEIDEHKEGPVYATSFALPYVSDDEEVIVSYCDYMMVFDYDDMIRKVQEGRYAGAVPSYTGFHPHLLHKGVYGGVLRGPDGVMLEYKEKHSFTDDLMDSHHSAGMYYFKNAKELKEYTKELLSSDLRVNGEQYTSMLFYFYLRDGKKIYVPEVTTFMQWGTPEDLEEYVCFEEFILGESKQINSIPKKRKINKIDIAKEQGFEKTLEYWKRYLLNCDY